LDISQDALRPRKSLHPKHASTVLNFLVLQRPESLRAAAGEKTEVEEDPPPFSIACSARQLRQGLSTAFKLTERFKFGEHS